MKSEVSYHIDNIAVTPDGKIKVLIINGTDVIAEIKKDVLEELSKESKTSAAKKSTKTDNLTK